MAYYHQNVIAFIWDFDRTLIQGNMQDPLLRAFKVDPPTFWAEVNGLAENYAQQGLTVNQSSAYLNHMLTYVRAGQFKGLSNERLRKSGADLVFYPGVVDMLNRTKQIVADDSEYAKHEIKVEHYVVSTGLRQIIEGSVVGSLLDGLWACEFIAAPVQPGGQSQIDDQMTSPISQVGYVIDDTTKTRAIFEINKGVNVNPEIKINGLMKDEDRRVPFEHMICVADGASDVPMFSVIKQNGGQTFAVWDNTSQKHFDEVALLQDHGRVLATFEGDFEAGKPADRWLTRAVHAAARRIVTNRQRSLQEIASARPPSHVPEHPESPSVSVAKTRMAATPSKPPRRRRKSASGKTAGGVLQSMVGPREAETPSREQVERAGEAAGAA